MLRWLDLFSVTDLFVLKDSPHAPSHPVLSFGPQHLPEMSPMPEAATIAKKHKRQAGEKVPSAGVTAAASDLILVSPSLAVVSRTIALPWTKP